MADIMSTSVRYTGRYGTMPSPNQASQLANARSKISSRFSRPTQPLAFRTHNYELERATGGRATSSNAGCRARVLSFVPGAEGRLWLRWMATDNPASGGVTMSLPAPLRRHRAALSGNPTRSPAALSLPSRATEAPLIRMWAAQSDLLGYRTPCAREGQHPRVSATRRWYDAPLTRPMWSGDRRLAVQVLVAASPARTRCGSHSAGQHSSPAGHLANSAAGAATSQKPRTGNGGYLVPKTF
jgi:hypothetical protein